MTYISMDRDYYTLKNTPASKIYHARLYSQSNTPRISSYLPNSMPLATIYLLHLRPNPTLPSLPNLSPLALTLPISLPPIPVLKNNLLSPHLIPKNPSPNLNSRNHITIVLGDFCIGNCISVTISVSEAFEVVGWFFGGGG